MRETLFLKRNSKRWKEYENAAAKDPDELAERFLQLTDDLAYAQTFYPGSNTVKYLNGLASRFHHAIYSNKKEEKNRFIKFWKYELPLIVRRHHRTLLYALIFFLVFCLIGALSAAYDANFVRLILGDNYVNMTNANIEKGDPFGVYKQGNSLFMFISIAFNNLMVAFLTFVEGIIVSIGSLWQLFKNGLMLGSFQYYFFSKGLGWNSVLVIWIHGVLEISSIILAGGAGMIMGNSLLFPKSYSRLQSLKKGAIDGLKIAIGIVPFFLVAAFFEGFVTRHTGMPKALSISILISSLCIICWYFIIYPIQLKES